MHAPDKPLRVSEVIAIGSCRRYEMSDTKQVGLVLIINIRPLKSDKG